MRNVPHLDFSLIFDIDNVHNNYVILWHSEVPQSFKSSKILDIHTLSLKQQIICIHCENNIYCHSSLHLSYTRIFSNSYRDIDWFAVTYGQ